MLTILNVALLHQQFYTLDQDLVSIVWHLVLKLPFCIVLAYQKDHRLILSLIWNLYSFVISHFPYNALSIRPGASGRNHVRDRVYP